MRSLHKDNTTLQFNNDITPLIMRVVKFDGLGNEGGKVSVCNSRGQSHPTGSYNKLTYETGLNRFETGFNRFEIGINRFKTGSKRNFKLPVSATRVSLTLSDLRSSSPMNDATLKT